MSMQLASTLASGGMAALGVVLVVIAFRSRGEPRRQSAFRAGMVCLTLSGGLTIAAGLAGWVDSSAMFGGFLLVLLCTGASLMPRGGRSSSGDAGPVD
jgi:hypothetical protein